MNDNPTDADDTLYNALTQLFMAGTVDDSLQEAVAEAKTAVMRWHQQALEAAEIQARIDEIDRLGNYKGQFEGRWDLNDAVEERTAELEAALKETEVKS